MLCVAGTAALSSAIEGCPWRVAQEFCHLAMEALHTLFYLDMTGGHTYIDAQNNALDLCEFLPLVFEQVCHI